MAADNQTDADGQQEPGQHAPTTKDVNDASRRPSRRRKSTASSANAWQGTRCRKGALTHQELEEKAGHTADLESKLSKVLKENEKLKNQAKQAEHEEESPRYAPTSRPRWHHQRCGDDEKQIGEYDEELMKVFADMRSRGTVADQSARTDRPRLNIPAARTSSTP